VQRPRPDDARAAPPAVRIPGATTHLGVGRATRARRDTRVGRKRSRSEGGAALGTATGLTHGAPSSLAHVLVILTFESAAAAAVARDGLTFTYRVQSSARGTREELSPAMLATVRIAGPNARVDVREGNAPRGEGRRLHAAARRRTKKKP
jgi:hypothetical protein